MTGRSVMACQDRGFWSEKSVLQKIFGTFSTQDLCVAKAITMSVAVATVMAVAMAVAAGTPPLTSPVWVTADTAELHQHTYVGQIEDCHYYY